MRRRLHVFVLATAAALAVVTFCLYNGILQCNHPPRDRFPVRGVDVSHHQGVIDWAEIARQDVAFAFLKATEGSAFKDTRFPYNWREARKAGLAVGAYHFFLPDKSGREQADNFIGSVPLEADACRPCWMWNALSCRRAPAGTPSAPASANALRS